MTRQQGVVLIVGLVALLLGAPWRHTQAQQTFGTNWTATFFNSTDLTGPVVATQVGLPGINFNWGLGSPVPGAVNVDGFSARFTSTQTFQQGTHQFTVTSDDGVRVLIDGARVLDEFVPRPLTTNIFDLPLTAGLHSLTVEYFEELDQASVSISWQLIAGGGGIGGILPPFAGPTLTPAPTNTPAPTALPPIPPGAISATVVDANVLNVRAAPSALSTRLGQILRGQTFQVVGRDPDARWLLLQLSNFQGWAFGFYLHVNGNAFNVPVVSSFVLTGNPGAFTAVVGRTTATLRLRAAPTVLSGQIGRIPWGDGVGITGRTPAGDWYRVHWRDTDGWVAAAWVDIVEGNPNNVPVV